MPNTYDQDGNPVRSGLGFAPGETAGTPDNWSFGASLWEFLNPGQVQQEDAAIGKAPRDYYQIWDDAFYGMATAAEESRQEIVAESRNIIKDLTPALLVGVLALGALAVLSSQYKNRR